MDTLWVRLGHPEKMRWIEDFEEDNEEDWIMVKEYLGRTLGDFYERRKALFKEDEVEAWKDVFREKYRGWGFDDLLAEYEGRWIYGRDPPPRPQGWDEASLIEALAELDEEGGNTPDSMTMENLNALEFRHEMILSVLRRLIFSELPRILKELDERLAPYMLGFLLPSPPREVPILGPPPAPRGAL